VPAAKRSAAEKRLAVRRRLSNDLLGYLVTVEVAALASPWDCAELLDPIEQLGTAPALLHSKGENATEPAVFCRNFAAYEVGFSLADTATDCHIGGDT
jgi:hypothetical protein